MSLFTQTINLVVGTPCHSKVQLKKSTVNTNPHAAKYKIALGKYKKMAKKSNAILEGYNNSTGARRMKYADELRLIKHEVAKVQERYTEAKAQYTDWKSNNSSVALDFSKKWV